MRVNGNQQRWERQKKNREGTNVKEVDAERAARVQMDSRGLGDWFAHLHPDLFSGCGSCRKGVIRVMNRWLSGEVTDDQIELVTNTIAAKKKKLDREMIKSRLRTFLNA